MTNSPLDVALAAVKESGNELLKLSKKPINYQLKSSHDVLAEGDLISEKIILKKIKQAFPSHSILSEEAGKSGVSEYLWIIDPIDGTVNFSKQLDEYCISVALSYRGNLELGVIYQPVLNKLYVAEHNKGAFLNGERISVSNVNKLSFSLLATDNSSKLDTRKINFVLLSKLCLNARHIRIYGSSALHLARIAEGKLDAYFKTHLNYWDYAAGLLLVHEAGGNATDMSGNPVSENSENIVVSNGKLHSELLYLFKKNI